MSWIKMPSTVHFADAYTDLERHLVCIVDQDLKHLSISHADRYPTWDEIHAARDYFLPPNETFAMYFPPKTQYVNVQKNCFHLFDIRIDRP